MAQPVVEGGYFLFPRAIFNTALQGRPHLWIVLFTWLLCQARFRDGDSLKRGQVLTTIAEMRDSLSYFVGYRKVRPTKEQIRGAYEGLAKASLITTSKTTRGMVITIQDYITYQTPKSYETHAEPHNDDSPKPTMVPQGRERKEKRGKKDDALFVEIVNHLNALIGKNFKPTSKDTRRHIQARWNEGYRLGDFIKVIDDRVARWANDPKMVDYLRPMTLFGSKFESYLNANGIGPEVAPSTQTQKEFDFEQQFKTA